MSQESKVNEVLCFQAKCPPDCDSRAVFAYEATGESDGPGPGSYKLPPVLGRYHVDGSSCELVKPDPTRPLAPAFSISGRLKERSLEVEDPCAPIYDPDPCWEDRCILGPTIKGRHETCQDPDSLPPGPNAYPATRPEVTKPRAPAYSIRKKLETKVKRETQGPEYNLLPPINSFGCCEKVLERISSPCVTLKGRWKESCSALESSPGPIYDIRAGDMSCYCSTTGPTFGSRGVRERCPEDSPSPQSYRAELVQVTRPKSRSSTIGRRHGHKWVSWTRLGVTEFDLDAHVQSLGWALASVIFGFIILSYDTRSLMDLGSNRRLIRDRILGLEQRYFLVIWNSMLLYVTLLWKFHGGNDFGRENLRPK